MTDIRDLTFLVSPNDSITVTTRTIIRAKSRSASVREANPGWFEWADGIEEGGVRRMGRG